MGLESQEINNHNLLTVFGKKVIFPPFLSPRPQFPYKSGQKAAVISIIRIFFIILTICFRQIYIQSNAWMNSTMKLKSCIVTGRVMLHYAESRMLFSKTDRHHQIYPDVTVHTDGHARPAIQDQDTTKSGTRKIIIGLSRLPVLARFFYLGTLIAGP
jgi:hypothetical protein